MTPPSTPERQLTKGERTRTRLVEATASLLRRQGYHATGLSQVISESGAPRGSLYFYFPDGKEALACAALEAAGAEWRRRIDEVLQGTPGFGEAIRAVCRLLGDDLAASGFEQGCPLATVALEASATSERVRGTVAAHYRGWEEAIVTRLTVRGMATEVAERVATFALAAVEGGLLLAKVKRDRAPIDAVGESLAGLAEFLVPSGARTDQPAVGR